MRNVLICCALLLFSFQARAQLFPNRVYAEEKGLNQKFIFSITQDTNGVLLLGTENGITAFNGDRFSGRGATAAMAEKQVSCVYSDSRGVTWIGHFQKGISCIEYGKTRVVDSSVRVSGRINSLTEDQFGRIWGISEGQGIFCIDRTSKRVAYPATGNLTSGRLLYQNGKLIAGGDNGVTIYGLNNSTDVLIENTLVETEGKIITAITGGRLNSQDFLFAAAQGEGVFCYRTNGGQFEFVGFLSADLQLMQKEFTAMVCDESGVLWVATLGEGLRKILLRSNGLPERIDRFTMNEGLSDDNIKSLFVDAENNVWLGTFGHGLIEIPYTVFHFYNQSNGLIRSEVNCVTQDENGVLWIGTDAGVTRFCGTKTPCKSGGPCTRQFGKKDGFDDVNVTCMVTDTAGLIWIGTEHDGLYRLDPCTEKFEHLSELRHLSARHINTLALNREGHVLAGTTEGVYIYDPVPDEFSFLTTMEGLLHNDVRHLYTDRANAVWFSSEGTPPYSMHGKQFHVYQDIDHLKGFMISGVCEDYTGTRWIATEGDGVFAYNGNSFRQYTSASGLKSDHCIAVMTEENGILWVVHKSGLSMKFPDDTSFRYFSSIDSRLLQEMNASVYRANDGTIYFCSESGLIEVPSQNKDYLRRYPRVSLSGLFINGDEHEITTSLDLPAGTYNLSFEFNSILLSSPGFNPFYYRIIGADTVWRLSSDRSIIIPQLSSGDYVLQVSGVPPGSRRAVKPYSVRINIAYPFWQRTWFIASMIVLAPVLLLTGVRIRTVRLMRHNQMLHTMVKEKTHQLETEKESVARMNVELQAKTKDITDSIHYAMRIQMAILPDTEMLAKVLPESFVFYRPRDIVSGDFYWFAEKGDLFFIAIVDCTGHGVPGALMSMIGTTLLNKVVFDYRIDSPSGILDLLNREIKLALHQQDTADSSHDGMDLALCVYDRRNRSMRFAGAGRPLFLVRDGHIIQYKTNKGGLGGVYSHKSQLFSEIDFNLESGDTFYMYTDGYPDQFGSDERHKFSTRQLRQLLHDIASMPMEQQYRILAATFDNWKGNGEQCDDVLVAGFRIP